MKTTFLKPKGKSPPKNKQILFMNPLNLKNMKTIRTIILATALLFSLLTQAQITKGNWMMGGSGSFTYDKYEKKDNGGLGINYVEDGVYTILLEPNIAYFVSNKFAIGSSISYLNSFYEGQKLDSEGMVLSFNPLIRYYILDTDKNYNIFIEPSYNRYIHKFLGNSSGFSMKTGFAYFLNSSVAVETALKYSNKDSEYYSGKSIKLTIGLQIHLEKNKKL